MKVLSGPPPYMKNITGSQWEAVGTNKACFGQVSTTVIWTHFECSNVIVAFVKTETHGSQVFPFFFFFFFFFLATSISKIFSGLKGTVHPKMKIRSSFQNQMLFFCVLHKSYRFGTACKWVNDDRSFMQATTSLISGSSCIDIFLFALLWISYVLLIAIKVSYLDPVRVFVVHMRA